MVSLVFIGTSCTKTDNTNENTIPTGTKENLLTKFEMATAISSMISEISYTKDLKPEVITSKEDLTVKSVRKFTYDGSKFLNSKTYSDVAMTNETGSETFSYNSTGQIIGKVVTEGADVTTYTFVWTSGKITQVTAEVAGASFNDKKMDYEWTGDNITKVTNYSKDSTENYTIDGYNIYTFDDKTNPLTVKLIPDYDDPNFLNKNNTMKIEYYDPNNTIQGMANFTYTYDSENKPVTGTFDFAFLNGLYTFTYSSLTKE